MKFHHLSREDHQFGSSQELSSSTNLANNNQRNLGAVDLVKQQQLVAAAANLQQHLQNQFNSQLHNQQHNTQSFSDNELDDDDFENNNNSNQHHQQDNFYADQFVRRHQQQLAAATAAASALAATGSTGVQSDQADTNDPDDNSNYLMDKNKKLFPQKLWELIHNPNIQHCLRWSQDGQRVYLNRQEFEQYYLKTPNNQFHTQKAISFVRQMNMYGFRKVDDCYYENDNFRRDSKHLLKNMVRRHPNKALYVGLVDHHQLNAAAAAAAAVNHQIHQHLQVQDQSSDGHKQQVAAAAAAADHHQRAAAAAVAAEQALRLNNYLNANNNTHQQHIQSQLAAVAAHHQQQQIKHSLESQQQVGENLTISQQQRQQQQMSQQQSLSSTQSHQHKKSRLLENFYSNQRQKDDQWSHEHYDLLRKNTLDAYNCSSGSGGARQTASGELSPRSLVAHQTVLHETLVRSLLQLKQHHHAGDILANLAQQHQSQQQQRSLLESLASLSSAGTGSIMDPSSNSPTERTTTPPSRSSSSLDNGSSCASSTSINIKDTSDDNIALNLAKTPNENDCSKVNHVQHSDEQMNVNKNETMNSKETRVDEFAAAAVGSPLDGQKKVRKFLEDQMNSHQISEQIPDESDHVHESGTTRDEVEDVLDQASNLPQKKRFKRYLVDEEKEESSDPLKDLYETKSLEKSLILKICDSASESIFYNNQNELERKKLELDDKALDMAANICSRFMHTLLKDAARLSVKEPSGIKVEVEENDVTSSKVCSIDTESLMSALESIQSKLTSLIQTDGEIFGEGLEKI